MKQLFFTLLISSLSANEWKLVWSDEFDGKGHPDPKKWGYESGFVRNKEQQYYTTKRLKNARLENGHLVIEVRAKVPQGPGVWPAIWTLGDNIDTVGWPRCGEIDILEFVGKDPQHIHVNTHFHRDGKHSSDHKKRKGNEPWKDFHTYSIEWDADWIHFAYDDVRYHSFRVSKGDTEKGNPFHKKHYLILNLALGGNWGGKIDDSIFPSRYLIDYVRVYQRP